ncbi:TIGR00725 family protein [Pasteurella multocida]|uniref:TIGR00725 family protein n=1 Tax=Pasteurella multocida TaxID=747 RepID=UPI003978F49A
MKKYIVVIATKNRLELLNTAIQSILSQSKQPNEVIITSDSNSDNQIQEQALCSKFGFTFVKNKHVQNYAGNLNSAIDYIISSRMIERNESIDNTFIAFLDDDDYWHNDYLSICAKNIKQDTDFIVSGLIYYSDNKTEYLSIPNALTIQDFLEKNPHIQGSNTFIRLTTLLKAGCFDENMPSTTDRDLFTRVMMLNPKYEIINQHLVHIDAKNSRTRLTNTQDNKKESLAKFYAKYGGLMNVENKNAFFQRANLFASLSEQDISEVLKSDLDNYQSPKTEFDVFQRVVFAFISISPFFTKRMINEIRKQNLTSKKIVCIANYPNDINEINEILSETTIPYSLITLDDIQNLLDKENFLSYLDRSCLKNGYISNIATARSILHFYAKQESENGDVVWILDDDMEFSQNIIINENFVKKPLDISAVINKYRDKYDVVIGSYSQDAPLPTLSTLRTSLLDYVYSNKLYKNQYYDQSIYQIRDYYYDLTDETNRHLETPVKLVQHTELADILSGKAVSRLLFSNSLSEFDAYSRGGNTLIFNREVLDIPNISLVLANTVARRSDYFWVQQVKKHGYRIIGSTFSTFHHREKVEFNYKKEMDKQIQDLIGSSFTKANAETLSKSKTEFYSLFKINFQKRLTKIISNYFRIIGLFEILENKEYLEYFNKYNLYDFVRCSKKYLEPALVQSGFGHLYSQIAIQQHYLNLSKYKNIVEKTFSTTISNFLGLGEEGAIFSDGIYVYKILYEKLEDGVVSYYDIFSQCSALFAVNVKQLDEHTIIYYSYESDWLPYEGGFAVQIADLLIFLKSKGLILTNIKKQNFIVVNQQVKLIDYGKNIEPYTPEKYSQSIKRAYQMLKYPSLSVSEYKQMVSQSYLEQNSAFLFGIEHFHKLLAKRYKEQTHDPIVVDLIKSFNPNSILDYGAGKCKIANILSNDMNIDVFDVNIEKLKLRANNKINIIENIEKVDKKFDVINCNLVLCCIDNKQAIFALKKMHQILNNNGHLILSICNPFFDDIQYTETRKKGYPQPYSLCATYNKETQFICREEYHRPFAFYQRLLSRNGFELLEIKEDDGVNADTLNPISEHLIMICRKTNRTKLNDCSLLIKTNPMEHKTIYKNVVHIIRQLEKNCLFAERVIVVDGDSEVRLRRYDNDNRQMLEIELNKLLANEFIDRIVFPDCMQQSAIYQKYFTLSSDSAYSANGQALLASLVGLESIKTRYVFQTDADILYCNQSDNGILTALDALKAQQALTLSLSICHSDTQPFSFGHRTEVRSSFIDLQKLNDLLPLENPIQQGIFSLPWHRALDKKLTGNDSIRLHQSDLFFIHPENDLKNSNLISIVRKSLAKGECTTKYQNGNVNLTGEIKDWINKTMHSMVLFVRGRNTQPEELKRLFDSLKKQTYQYFHIVYIDDNSDELSSSYAEMLFEYDNYFRDRIIAIFNDFRIGSLANFKIMYKYIVKNPNAIIVNIDNDDCLLKNTALEIIQKQFDAGADVTVGNCFRVDKPLKHYQVEAFEQSWKRNGDNIWLHPKCFRNYLCQYIQNNLQIDGKYIEVATDYAIMLPIIQHAQNPIFIKEQIYYFDTSKENRLKEAQYKNAVQMKQFLLEQAKQNSFRKTIAVIGDSNISEQSSAYRLAYEFGKALVDNGFRVQTGGLGGIMEAALKGAKSSCQYKRGDTIAIIPSSDENEVNDYADVIIPTGLDMLRNGKVIQADAVIVIGGGAGTLSEIAMAWQQFKLIIAFHNIDGWSKQLANQKIDGRKRYSDIPDDRVYGVDNVDDAIMLIKQLANHYTRVHYGIKYKKSNMRNK